MMNPYEKTITFFLGAGFSAPAMYPTGKKLNEMLREFDLSNLPKSNDKEGFIRVDNSQFIKLKNSQIHKFLLAEYFQLHSDFNYEEFYDHYNMYFESTLGPRYGDKRRIALQDIIGIGSIEDTLLKYDELYNCLLYREFQCSEVNEKQYYHLYSHFIDFIKYLLEEKYTINIFSLNHDRLLENLFVRHDIPYSDGFEKKDVRFTLKKDPSKRIFHFTGEFKEKLRLYKVHGSVDLYSSYKPGDLLWLKPEFTDNWNFYQYEHLIDEEGKHNGVLLYPRFLTGKDMKLPTYSMIEHFKNSLDDLKRGIEGTNKLIIIGYGFGDEHIQNEYLQPAFQKNGVVSVIDENFEGVFLIANPSFCKIKKFIQKVTFENYLDIINGPKNID